MRTYRRLNNSSRFAPMFSFFGHGYATRLPFSEYQYAFRIVGSIFSIVFDPALILVSQVVESKTVFIRIIDIQQLVFQRNILCLIHITLKNRVLHSLTIGYTDLCDFRQSLPSLSSCCIYVVRYQNEHNSFQLRSSPGLISRRTGDILRYRPGCIVPTTAPGYAAPIPKAFSPL